MSSPTPLDSVTSLAPEVWRAQQLHHVETLRPYAQERMTRSAEGRKHPINDFLFEYYSLKPIQLLRWSPGVNVQLIGAKQEDLEWGRLFRPTTEGLLLLADDLPPKRASFVAWVVHYLESVEARTPSFNCLGLHEWAMVYREEQIRHSSTPLRLSAEELNDFVESQDLRCTHYDAFRFFSTAAVPRNRFSLARATTDRFDQSGCVHVNMDLYKWAYKLCPFTSGELLRNAFLLAWEARRLDMRASPYDLREYGLEPIRIETHAGREEYVQAQREIHLRSQPIRERLLAEYRSVLKATEPEASPTRSELPIVSASGSDPCHPLNSTS